MKVQSKIKNNNQFELFFSDIILNKTESLIKKISNLDKSLLDIYSPSESLAFITSTISRVRNEGVILIVDTPELSRSLYEDCSEFLGNYVNVIHVPEIDTHPMSGLEFGSFSNIERNGSISKILDLKNKNFLAITSGLSVAQKTPNLEFLANEGTLNTHINQKIKISEIVNKLSFLGYERTHVVEQSGEFCVRGSLIDVFPVGNKNPVRIDFISDEIESIRNFDQESQKTIKHLKKVAIRVSSQLPTTTKTSIAKKNSDGCLLDIFDKNSILVIGEPQLVEISLKEYEKRFSFNKKDRFTYGQKDIAKRLLKFEKRINIKNLMISNKVTKNFVKVEKIDLNVHNPSSLDPIGKAANQIIEYSKNFIVMVASNNIERLKERVNEHFGEDKELKKRIYFEKKSINNSFGIKVANQGGVIFLGDQELFGIKNKIRNLDKSISRSRKSRLFEKGTLVVHEDHGISKFIGVTKLKGHSDREYLELHFADEDKLFVPADQISRIELYRGGQENAPKLHRLHGKEWERQKNRVKKSTEILASELLYIHSSRKNAEGFSFNKNDDWLIALESSFPFALTEDQQRSINEIYEDMESNIPMDRLLCGDVGFGKTELAIRASFKAVQSGKQVAILVPTTVLADQHYETFRARLGQFPVNIKCLSRLKTIKESNEIKKQLKAGQIDICIGTHKLLQNAIDFKDLGLFIIDEEHKFGVKQKEFLKSMRLNLDMLSLSATPIPRTMNLALSGVRDLSMIETAPLDRVSVKTYVIEENDELLREIILREKDRNGQVFIVYNRVNKIEKISEKIKQITSEVNVDYAHGRMDPRKLSEVMNNFANKNIDVLVCTTIIESGLDLPDSNTIVIINPHQLGLAQLYQLRGRVGRSSHQAYAYFVVPKKTRLNIETEKRLEAMTRFQYLGAGKEIALRDMEIRGVGNILGKEQSGNVNAIGLGLFLKFLESAVSRKQNRIDFDDLKFKHSLINLDLLEDIGIPFDYIPDIESRLEIYDHLSSIFDLKEMSDYRDELIDRFGQLPASLMNLIDHQKIKIYCSKLEINSINIKKDQSLIRFKFSIIGMENFIKEIFKSKFYISDKQIKINDKIEMTELMHILSNFEQFKSKFSEQFSSIL
ncbi:MAG: transcription-repair coupling factor [Dehalococcoidia bacterium]